MGGLKLPARLKERQQQALRHVAMGGKVGMCQCRSPASRRQAAADVRHSWAA